MVPVTKVLNTGREASLDMQPLRGVEVCFLLDPSVNWRFFSKLMAVEVSIRVISPG